MDEMKMVKELRNTMPEMPSSVEDTVRRGLRGLAAGDRPADRGRAARRPSRRFALRAGLAGALVAAAGVGGVGALPDGGGPVPGTSPALRLVSATELGDRAAEAAERLPYKPPSPKQWIYTRFVTASGFDMNRPWEGVDPKGRETVEQWERADGKAGAEIHAGKLQVTDYTANGDQSDEKRPAFHPGNYHTLPTDPDALLRRITAEVGPNDPQGVFDTMSRILEHPLPPKLRAAVYRALPKVSGVGAERDVPDAAGRRGVAFARTDHLGDRRSIVLDPATYRYLGTRHAVARTRTDKVGDRTVTYRAGTVLGWYAHLDQGIVDRPGRRS
ncbi:hypothetical protein GCM10009678_73470 [Actinomadura kijaniata]|uniref:CU044_5270 family protein n=1 Tax=Actinomadura kijaniata TaxID=46161 RepID=UPI002FE710B6